MNNQIQLHQYTNILLNDVCIKFLQFIRQSQISKLSANKLLVFIKSLLPTPNSVPSNMNNLLAHLNILDYFEKRTVCTLCQRILQYNQTKCNDCLAAETKHVAHILDSNISLLLTTIVSRLVDEIQQYKNVFSNTTDEDYYDIPFAKQYKKLLIQHSDKNLLSLIMHIDGIRLVKSTKLKLWLCSASIIELPPNIRIQRQNMILLSMYVGYTEPNIKLWLESTLRMMKDLKEKGITQYI